MNVESWQHPDGRPWIRRSPHPREINLHQPGPNGICTTCFTPTASHTEEVERDIATIYEADNAEAEPEGMTEMELAVTTHRIFGIVNVDVRSKAPEIFRMWLAHAQRQSGKKLKILKTDGAKEFRSNELEGLLAEKGIKHQVSLPYLDLERALQYFISTPDIGLSYSTLTTTSFNLNGYVDADHAADPANRRSRTDFCVAPHSSEFPPTIAPLQTLHMDVWGLAPVGGTDQERYFLLVDDDYTRYTTVSPLRRKADVSDVLIPWIRATRRQLRERFRRDLPILRLHSDRGGEFSFGLLENFCRDEGIRQTFTLPASPQHNGIAERRIGLIMEVACTSITHAAAPHFLWPFAVRYAAHQLNLRPRVSEPETLPTLRWTGKVGDASVFRVWGALSLVRDAKVSKLSSRTFRCVFIGFPIDAPPWQFYHPRERRVFSSQDVTFDESVCFYRLHPHTSHPGPTPSGVSQVDPPPLVEPLEISSDSSGPAEGVDPAADDTAATRRSPRLVNPPGFLPRPSSSPPQPVDGADRGGAVTGGADPGGATSHSGGGAVGETAGGARAATGAGGASRAGGAGGARAGGATGAGGAGGPGGAGGTTRGAGAAAGAGGTGAASTGGAAGAGGASGGGGAGATSAAGAGGAGGARAARAGGAGAASTGGAAGAGGAFGAGGARGASAAGAGGAGGAAGTGGAGGATTRGAGPAGALRHLLGLPLAPTEFPVAGTTPPLLFPQLLPHSPLPTPAPYTAMTESLTERREPETRASTPEHREYETKASAPAYVRRVPRPRAPAVLGTHKMTLRPSSVPQRVVLPSPPASSLPDVAEPPSDLAHASNPTVTRFLATVVTDATFSSPDASALVAELVDFDAAHHLDYPASLVSDPDLNCPLSVRGEVALGCDVLEGRQEELDCAPSLYGLRQSPHEWHDTLRTTLATLGFAPSTADPSLILRTDTTLPPFYVLVYDDDLVFATADTEALVLITRERARRTITLTQSHMVHQVLQRFLFQYSSPQPTPLSTGHSLSAPPSDESVEPSGPYSELVRCLMYLMTCTRPDLAYPLSLLARYMAPSTSGMWLVLGGRGSVVLTRHSDSSWADDQATQLLSQGYTFSLGSGSVSWRSTRSSSVLGSSYRLGGAASFSSSSVRRQQGNACLVSRAETRAQETKHIGLRYFLARELQQRGQQRLAYVVSWANTANVFTKALGSGDHQRFCTALGLVPTLPHLLVA
ncbi:unnamed protein product [Closterium sp. NIES-54]